MHTHGSENSFLYGNFGEIQLQIKKTPLVVCEAGEQGKFTDPHDLHWSSNFFIDIQD